MKKQPKKHQIVKISLRMKDFFKSWLAPMILLILGSYLVYLVMSLFSTGFTFKLQIPVISTIPFLILLN